MALEPSGSLNFESAPTPQGGKRTRAVFVHHDFLLRIQHLRAGPSAPAHPRCRAEPTGHSKGHLHPYLSAGDPHPAPAKPPARLLPPRTQPQASPHTHTAPDQHPQSSVATPCPGTHHGGSAWLWGVVEANGCKKHASNLPALRLTSH